jgi:ATP/maltotriose-dependent transcriptional regulator MalT
MTAPLSGQDALLATKLHVPEPHGFVQRRRLAQALDDGLAKGRVSVFAPAGSSKSTPLAD